MKKTKKVKNQIAASYAPKMKIPKINVSIKPRIKKPRSY